MATIPQQIAETVGGSRSARQDGYPVGGLRFDLMFSLLVAWFIGGLFLDGWAHNNGFVDDTFFTPWHAVLYSGYVAIGLLLTATQMRHVLHGHRWLRALPRGYLPGLVGIVLFGFGGLLDFGWHSAFGFESGVEPLLSPPHLLLAFSAFLFVTGPLRAAWGRRDAVVGWPGLLPALVSALTVISALTFFTQYAHFMSSPAALVYPPRGSTALYDIYGVSSVLIPTGILMGTLMLLMRRWTLPPGTFTLILFVNSSMMWLMRQRDTEGYALLLLAPLVAGLVGDGLYALLRPGPQRRLALRIFAFILPFVLFLAYFLLLNQIAQGLGRPGLWWEIHMWLGVPVLAGAVGLLASYIAVPFPMPDDEGQA